MVWIWTTVLCCADKFMQHFLHDSFLRHRGFLEKHPGAMVDVGSGAVVDKLLVAAQYMPEIWLVEYLPQNREEVGRSTRCTAWTG